MTETQEQGQDEAVALLCQQRDGAIAELRALAGTLDGCREQPIKREIERLNEAIWRVIRESRRG